MEPKRPVFETLVFLEFELTLARRQLLRDGIPLAIGGRALDLLALLEGHAGEMLDNRVLMRVVWPNTVVEEVNLRVQIAALRKLLGCAGHCHCIVNQAGRGYCFTAPVTRRALCPLHEELLPPAPVPAPPQADGGRQAAGSADHPRLTCRVMRPGAAAD